MLQRIYGTAFAPRKGARRAPEAMLEEAKQRDHRRLGQALDLFQLPSGRAGLAVLPPEGHRRLQHAGRSTCAASTSATATARSSRRWSTRPSSGRRPATTTTSATTCSSCEADERRVRRQADELPRATATSTRWRKHSYRDLPIRYADFSRLHRFERSGVAAGLTRVRSFSQDDAHIFCTPEQIEDELDAVRRDDVARSTAPSASTSVAVSISRRGRKSSSADRRHVGRGRGGAPARCSRRPAIAYDVLDGRRRLLRTEDRLRLPRRARALVDSSPPCRSTARCRNDSSSTT